jgi:hypothetical protein
LQQPQAALTHDRQAGAPQARAEWEELLRSAEVRLMAFEHIREQTYAAPDVTWLPAGQESMPDQALEQAPTAIEETSQQRAAARSLPATRQQRNGSLTKSAHKSRAGAIAHHRMKAADDWTVAFYSSR